KLAEILGVHRNTLHYKLKVDGIHKKFSDISDDELDVLLRLYKKQQPTAGLQYTLGFLATNGI
ncbi:hypothetical protein BD410DRAFT_709811, partial [Rickenella mellea]